ncbi:MAG TPA: hydroxymethylbilane synthase, partial [Phycisphaerales bacterium]|nr:hydroxymethylbilane synthase [Phycisphaerales bacterium]
MTKTLRIGTRRSRLATAQATLVVDALRRAHPGLACELAPLLTRGDRRTGPLADAGGKGLFTAELEDALRAGRIHLAVHSAKDMPAEMPAGLVIAAVPDRADPRDALVSRDGLAPADLPRGARVGTGSERRRVQLLALRDDLEIVALRGNVETRLSAALDGALDAVVLAMAGLERVGLAQEHATRVRPLDVATFLPAAGQGALAVQSQADSPAAALAEAI